MKLVSIIPLFAGALFSLSVSAGEAKGGAAAAVSPEAQAAYDDIQKTLGMVPSFFKLYPQEAIAAAWEDMKSVQMNPNTALSGKYKELIGLGVSAQIPCRFCTYFHTEAAKLNGASDRELHEAVAIAGMTRKWSAMLYGTQVDEATFRKDADKIVAKIKGDMEKMKKGEQVEQPGPVTDAASVKLAMEKMFGFAPAWMLSYPPAGLPAMWKTLMSLEMNPATALPGKVKSLMSLAVGSQVPCRYCTYMDSEFAKLEGATQAELTEAVAMAAIVRQWSTFLNGINLEEKAFRMEADKLFKILRKRMSDNPLAAK